MRRGGHRPTHLSLLLGAGVALMGTAADARAVGLDPASPSGLEAPATASVHIRCDTHIMAGAASYVVRGADPDRCWGQVRGNVAIVDPRSARIGRAPPPAETFPRRPPEREDRRAGGAAGFADAASSLQRRAPTRPLGPARVHSFATNRGAITSVQARAVTHGTAPELERLGPRRPRGPPAFAAGDSETNHEQ